MFFLEPTRAKRRRILSTLVQQRYAVLCRRFQGHPPQHIPAGHYASISPYGCGCRKRTKGRPKVACGMCKIGRREHVIAHRQEARRLKWGGTEE